MTKNLQKIKLLSEKLWLKSGCLYWSHRIARRLALQRFFSLSVCFSIKCVIFTSSILFSSVSFLNMSASMLMNHKQGFSIDTQDWREKKTTKVVGEYECAFLHCTERELFLIYPEYKRSGLHKLHRHIYGSLKSAS